MSTELADMRVLSEITRLIAESGPHSVLPASDLAEQISRDVQGSAFSKNEIIDEIVLRAAELGVPVKFGPR